MVPASASEWSGEARLGGAWNLPLPLTLRQRGESDLRILASWDSRAFHSPLYYTLRAARWSRGRAWALELVHHKLHLRRPPPEVRSFAISHGYNLLTLQRLLPAGDAMAAWSAGLVLAHPENEVRGERLSESGGMLGSGYYLGGPTWGGALGPAPPEREGAFVSAELKLTLSWARVPVARGSATVPNVALHAVAGLGWR